MGGINRACGLRKGVQMCGGGWEFLLIMAVFGGQ